MLPKILPLLKEIELPVSKYHASVQAFTVKEEKNLLLSKDLGDMILENSLMKLIELKTTFKEAEAKVEDLCVCDIVILLIEILSLSKTSTRDLAFVCSNKVGPKDNQHECGTKISMTVDISDYRIEGVSENGKIVHLTDEIGVELQYPRYAVIAPLQAKDELTSEDYIDVYVDCIKAIYQGDEMFTDFTKEEAYEWFNSLPGEYLKTFIEFVEKMPSVVLDYDVVCPTCGNKRSFHAVNAMDFFTSSTVRNA